MADRRCELQLPKEWEEGSDVPVTALLWDDKRPARNIAVQIYVDGNPKLPIRTKTDGRATMKLRGLRPGKHQISMGVADSPHIESNIFYEIMIKVKPKKSDVAKQTETIREETALHEAEAALARATAPAKVARIDVREHGGRGEQTLVITLLDADGKTLKGISGIIAYDGCKEPSFTTNGTGSAKHKVEPFTKRRLSYEVIAGGVTRQGILVGPKSPTP